MIKLTHDKEINAFVISYQGSIDANHAEQLYSELLVLLPQGEKGFRVLVDFSEATSVSPEIKDSLKKIMDILNAQGVEEIIRIIPDPACDVGLSIMSIFHYSKNVKLITVSCREEAESRIKAWKAKSKIAFVEMKETWQKEFVQKHLSAHSLVFLEETAQNLAKDLEGVNILSVFINSRVDKNLISQLPNLRCICTRSTGFDHIDLKTAQAKNIAVFNVPLYGENTVAEHTFALILSLSRNLKKAYLRTYQNNFNLDGLMGFDLKGKTLGVIGTGHIGLHVIRIALGFGMKVIAYDIKRQNFISEVLNFEYVSLEALLEQSDIISLHAPYLPGTHHLINKNNISLIKKGALLVNTARGGLIETEALIKALDKEILSGVGLDVLENEEYLLEDKRLSESMSKEKQEQVQKNQLLLQRENVIFTPHLAFYSYEAIQRILQTTLQNIHDFSNGNLENQILLKR